LNDIAFVELSDNRGIGIRRAARAQPVGRHDGLRGARDRRGRRGEEKSG
jgi:hypothetical protein